MGRDFGHSGTVAVVICCVLATPSLQPALAAREGSPRLSADIWKREVVLQEPILVRLNMRNPTDESMLAVPPYLNIWGLGQVGWPLEFTVTDGKGNRVPNQWEFAKSGYEVVAYGLPWCGPCFEPLGRKAQPAPRRPWVVPPGETAFMWINLLQFYPLDEPGRYHILFHYDARPEMLVIPYSGEAPPTGVWTGKLEADAGSVTIAEPEGIDREAATFLRDYRERRGVVISAGKMDGYALKPELLERFPTSVHATYAAFYQIWWIADMAPMRWIADIAPMSGSDRAAMGQIIDDFRTRHPDFPLNYQLPVALAFYDWYSVKRTVTHYPDQREVPGDLVSQASRLGEALRRAAAAAGDYSLIGKIEEQLWGYETRRARDLADPDP